MANNITTLSIKELKGKHFFIPDYQRGYRWSIKQVMDLLEDIDTFEPSDSASIYCLQPLVVKNRNANEEDALWEVIDGQQRLTTIFILLNSLSFPEFYSLKYQTRIDSEAFLKSIDSTKKGDNIDYFHIVQAKETIEQWLSQDANKVPHFIEKLFNNVKFIWYKTEENNPIAVFTRMNIGKIALTNSELIKALIMNSLASPCVPQERIALQWDCIENALENDEFWYFLNEKEDSPLQTRIDFIFDIIRKNRKLFSFPGVEHRVPDEKYATFQYFYDYLEDAKRQGNETKCVSQIWDRVLDIFYAFDEWYNDTELYHYIGFAIHTGVETVSNLLIKWFDDNNVRKDEFINNYLKPQIAERIKSIPIENVYETEEEGSLSKTACKPILLLYNLQFIINENKQFKEGKFQAGVHRRFPFHLYKTENWAVEHIDSASANTLEDEKDIVSFLWTSQEALRAGGKPEHDGIINDIDVFLTETIVSSDNHLKQKVFDELAIRIDNFLGINERLSGKEEKNRIWNFALLDRKTNRSYKNAIFPAKRRIIIAKSQGKETDIVKFAKESDVKPNYKRIGKSLYYVTIKSGEQAFVLPCTLNAFLKYHTLSSSNLLVWTKEDAQAYENAIVEVLSNANLL